MNGEFKEQRFDGLTARIFQHELDHLNGIVYTSLVSPIHLSRAKNKVKSNIKKLEKQRKELVKAKEANNQTDMVIKTPTPVNKETPKVFEYTT